MRIQGPGIVHGPQSINGPHRAAAPQSAAQPSTLGEVDQLDISPAADVASRSLDAAVVRQERVAEIRAAIEAGKYETDEKLSVALDRLLDEIG